MPLHRAFGAGRAVARTAFITGSSSGIGAAVVRRLASDGYVVGGFDLRPGEAGACARVFQGDVVDPAAVTAAVDAFVAEHGPLHCVVPCAGIVLRGLMGDIPGKVTGLGAPILPMTPEDADRVLDINVKGTMNVCRAAIPHMAKGGSIVLFSSTSSPRPTMGLSVYAASKGAIDALTRALAVELAPDVRVNAVLPGLVETPIWMSAGVSAADWERMKELVTNASLLRRNGQPSDIADAVAFLASDQAAWMTGVLMPVNGGTHLK